MSNTKKTTGSAGASGRKPTAKELLETKRPDELTAEEKQIVLDAIQKESESVTADEILRAVEKGDIQLEYIEPQNPLQNWTPENFKKFLFGQITWAQLEGMTMEQAYALAEFAYTMYQQGRYKDARTMFEGLVIGNPYDPYFHAMLGAVYTKLDMQEEAAQEFSIAIELDPEDINSYVNRGELLLQHGEFEYAMEDLKAAIDLDPSGKNPASIRARALAAATASVIKEMIDKRQSGEAPAKPGAQPVARGPKKPAAQPPKK